MSTGENLKQERRPTYLQIRYLLELKKLQPVKYGFQMVIAKRCNVSAVAVTKWMRKAMEEGIIDQWHCFTEYGNEWMELHGRLVSRVESYLEGIGSPKPEREDYARMMIEEMNPDLLESILSSYENQCRLEEQPRNGITEGIGQELEEGRKLPVRIAVYRMTKRELGENPFSMGNRAFRHEAELIREDGKEYLVLYPCEMQAKSRLNGEILTGRISSLKYQYNRGLCRADGPEKHPEYIRLPLEAFKMHVCPGGEIKGMLPIIVNCSVGNGHMPESTAVLMFWM